MVWALENASAEDRARLVEIYALPPSGTDGRAPVTFGEGLTDEQVTEVLVILERSGARKHAESEARRWRDIALRHIEGLPCLPDGKRDLTTLVSWVIAA